MINRDQSWSIVINWIGEAGYNAYFVVNTDEAEGVETAFVVNKGKAEAGA